MAELGWGAINARALVRIRMSLADMHGCRRRAVEA